MCGQYGCVKMWFHSLIFNAQRTNGVLPVWQQFNLFQPEKEKKNKNSFSFLPIICCSLVFDFFFLANSPSGTELNCQALASLELK